MNIKTFTLYIIAALLTAGCSHIADDERLIYVKPPTVQRNVLLEDFTGQRCINCPKASDVISQLLQDFGETAIVAVGIHGGPLGFAGNATTIGLATDLGDEYYKHWNLEYQPVGLVNRHSPVNYTDWNEAVRQELSKPATLDLNVEAAIGTDDALHIQVEARGTDGTTTGRLQVWVLEDGITALQLMPDGSPNSDYVHHHVLRAAVNGHWGDDFSVEEGEFTQHAFTFPLDAKWNPRQLSVVAFVYNDDGVQQATKSHVQ